jgi:hypothetical protein
MMILCGICASDESTTLVERNDGVLIATCTGSVHGEWPYTWEYERPEISRTLRRSGRRHRRLNPSAVARGWVVLPPGESPWDHLDRWMSSEVLAEREIDPERLDVCGLLGPLETVIGAPRSDDPDDLYVVFVYERAIIAESPWTQPSPLVGNAAFVITAMPRLEWHRQLSLPKSEIDADRIVHGSRASGSFSLRRSSTMDRP